MEGGLASTSNRKHQSQLVPVHLPRLSRPGGDGCCPQHRPRPACPCPTFPPPNGPFPLQQQDVLCLISTQPDQLPPGLRLLLALLASFRLLHLDSHLTKTNPIITRHPGRHSAPRHPRARRCAQLPLSPLAPPGLPRARRSLLCGAANPSLALGPPQPAHPFPCAPTRRAAPRPTATEPEERAGPASVRPLPSPERGGGGR